MAAGERSIRVVLRRAPVLLLAAAAFAAPETRETERVRVEAEVSPAEADEILRFLEEAHGQLAAAFKAKPAKGERILVQLREGAPGDPAPRTVSVQPQAGRYATRALLLREYVRVFYELARAKGRPAETPWCRAGLAEFLSGHDWDGRTLRMGVVPAVTAENLPGQALGETRQEGFDLKAVIEGRASASRALSWALYGHVSTGEGGKPLAGFAKFEPKVAGGVKTAPLFWQCFGKPEEYAPAFLKWLEGAQQPFVPLSGDWEGLGPGRVRGSAKGLGACRFQLPADEFRATVLVPKGKTSWRAGAVLSHESDKEYAVFVADWGGYLNIFRMIDGKQKVLEQGPGIPPSADGNYRFHLFRKKAQVYLMFEGGASYGPWELPGGGFGLALEGCDLTFTEVSWK
jgi:hypothetical protein